MTRQLARLVVFAVLVLSSRLAAADTAYDTVDAAEERPFASIIITGIVAGQGTPTTTTYSLAGVSSTSGIDPAARCDRMVLLAMSKPGKFQLVMVPVPGVSGFDCKLVVRTP